MSDQLNITGFSTALFSTWLFIEQWGLLLDAGDGVSAGLLQKSRKVKKIAITHPDRDHITGLMQLQQLNAERGCPEIFYPKDSGSFPALKEFFIRFDPGRGDQLTWTPVQPNDVVEIGKNLKLLVRENDHLQRAETQIKSVGYSVIRETRKLKQEFAGHSPSDLAALSKTHGPEFLTSLVKEVALSYSGDSRVHPASHWHGSQILIHESTFLEKTDAGERAERNHHSVLPDVLAMAREVAPKSLILNHFSSRYDAETIRAAIRKYALPLQIGFPVYALTPGKVVENILATEPVWPE